MKNFFKYIVHTMHKYKALDLELKNTTACLYWLKYKRTKGD